MKSARGFTLIEIMIVVALIGIMSAIALPYYGDYVIRGKIPDATSGLAARRVLMEQYFQDNRTYFGSAVAPQPCATDTTSSKYFTFTCSTLPGVAPTATTYIIAAIGKGSMAGFSYTIDQSNGKTSNIGTPARTNWLDFSTTCWIINTGGGSC